MNFKEKKFQKKTFQILLVFCLLFYSIFSFSQGIHPTITSESQSTCGGKYVIDLTATPSSNSYTYTWYRGNYSSYQNTIVSNSPTFSTTIQGFYKVKITNENGISYYSSPYQISSGTVISITDDQLNDLALANSGDTVQVRVSFDGPRSGESSFKFSDYSSNLSHKTTNSIAEFPVVINKNRIFELSSVLIPECSWYITSKKLKVITDNSISLSINEPSNKNVCSGGSVDLTYNKIGDWGDQEKSITIETYKVSSPGSLTKLTSQRSNSDKVTLQIPSNLAIGTTLKIKAYGTVPYFEETAATSFSLNVTSTGCSPRATLVSSYSSQSNFTCKTLDLTARPYTGSSTATYSWYLNDVLISSSQSNILRTSETGNYKVKIEDTNTGYNSTSEPMYVETQNFEAKITSTNPSFCGEKQPLLEAYPKGDGMIYEWYYPYQGINNTYDKDYLRAPVVSNGYRVTVSNLKCSSTYSDFSVKENYLVELLNENGNKEDFSLNSGQLVKIYVKFTGGTGPYQFTMNYNGQKKNIVTNENPYIFQDVPLESTKYSISQASNSCGPENKRSDFETTEGNSLEVTINPKPELILNAPSNLNVCAGERLTVPVTYNGTWPEDISLRVHMKLLSGSTLSAINFHKKENIIYPVPHTLNIGDKFTLEVLVSKPSGFTRYVESDFVFTVTENGCYDTSPIIYKSSSNCAYSETLTSFFNVPGSFNRQWYLDGQPIPGAGATNYYIFVHDIGNYSLKMTNKTTGEIHTSNTIFSNKLGIISTLSKSDFLCTESEQTTLTIPHTDGNNYTWYHSENLGGFEKVNNSFSNSLTTSTPGNYFCIINNNGCEVKTNTIRTCQILMNFENTSICQQGAIELSYYYSGLYYLPTMYLQAFDANTGQIVSDDFAVVRNAWNTGGEYKIKTNLPSNLPPGQYKLRLVQPSGNYESPLSKGILTVTSETPPNAPNLFLESNPTQSNQESRIQISGCESDVIWSDNNLSYLERFVYPNFSESYSAKCVSATGCPSSSSGNIEVKISCDPLEPNESSENASIMPESSFVSPELCLDRKDDIDWFELSFYGKKYYIRLYSSSPSWIEIKTYFLHVIQDNRKLTVKVLPGTSPSSNPYINIQLFDSDKNTSLAYMENYTHSDGRLFVEYNIPCPELVNLNDRISNSSLLQIDSKRIIAGSVIDGTSTVIFKAESEVKLTPGFSTSSSDTASFTAKIESCEND